MSKITNTKTIKCVRGCSGSASPSLHAQEEKVLPRRFTFYNLHSIICMLIKVKTISLLYLETDLFVNYRSAYIKVPVIICNAHLKKVSLRSNGT